MKSNIEALSGRGPSSIETFVLASPTNNDDPGSLFLLADFTDLPEAFRYLGATIAGAIQREYQNGNANLKPQQRLTHALRAANQELAKEAATSTAQWMGSLKAIVGAVAENQIFLSHTGGCTAFIVRKGTATEIPLEAGEGSRPFGSLTAGPLEYGDEILVAPRTLLGIADVPKELALNPGRFYAAIRKTQGATCLRVGVQQGGPASPAFRVPALQLASRLTSAFHAATSKVRLPRPFALPEFLNHMPALRTPRMSWLRLPAGLPGRKTILRPRSLFVLLVFIGIAALFIAAARSGDKPSPQTAAAAIQAARDALEQSETQVILDNNVRAIAALNDAIAKLETAPSDNPKIQELRGQLAKRRRELAGIDGVRPQNVLNFSGFPLTLNPAHIAVRENEDKTPFLSLSGKDHAAVWINNTLSETKGTFLFLPPPLQSHTSDIAMSDEALRLIAATPEGIAAIDPEKRAVTNVLQRANGDTTMLVPWDNGALAVFPDENTIRAFTLQDNETLAEHAWLKGKNKELAQARDAIAINHDVLVLLSNNTFLRFHNGNRAGIFRIEGFSWDGEARAFTALPDGRLAVLDSKNGRVLITNDKGDIQVQLEHPSFIDARDIALSPDGVSVFVLTADTLLRITLPTQ